MKNQEILGILSSFVVPSYGPPVVTEPAIRQWWQESPGRSPKPSGASEAGLGILGSPI